MNIKYYRKKYYKYYFINEQITINSLNCKSDCNKHIYKFNHHPRLCNEMSCDS